MQVPNEECAARCAALGAALLGRYTAIRSVFRMLIIKTASFVKGRVEAMSSACAGRGDWSSDRRTARLSLVVDLAVAQSSVPSLEGAHIAPYDLETGLRQFVA